MPPTVETAPAAEPAPVEAPQPAFSGNLVFCRWGNPQVKQGGILRLPAIFKDEETGQEYQALMALQMGPLKPCE